MNIAPPPESPGDIGVWARNRLIIALLPLAQGFARKMLVRYVTIGVGSFIGWAETNGFASQVPDSVKLIGALVLVAGTALDVGISYVSHLLHLDVKGEVVKE